MRTIKIDGQNINIPEGCDDFSEKSFIYFAGQLYRHISGEIDSFELKLLVVLNALNLRVINKRKSLISYSDLYRYLIVYFWSLIRKKTRIISREDHKNICRAARNAYFNKEIREDYLCENLIGLCNDIKFLQGDNLDLFFSKNPIRKIKGIGKGKRFDIGVALLSNLTAGEYADAMDLAIAWNETKDSKLLDLLVALLYYKGRASKHIEIIDLSDNKKLQRKLSKVDFAVKYGIYLWFISISTYFCKHQLYSLLYVSKPGEDNSEKIRMGMNEGIFRLSKCGYGSHSEIRQKPLIEFMDMHLSEVKSSISGALAAGIEPDKLAEKTGYTLTQIDMLS